MKVILTKQAEEDLEGIARYLIIKAGQKISAAVTEEIERVI